MLILLILAIVLILLAGIASGYGYYRGGPYAAPAGLAAAVALVLLLAWIFWGGPIWHTAPP